ncbi:MAG TPA: FAD-dependent oxidoreductase, partial [Bradyrhizobium sp.]|nr:FAD-dependent oxidoreductase [Bradyrhizobium sp.]
LAGVAKACSDNSVTFFRDSPVEEVTEDDGGVTVKTARGVIRAKHAVVATNSSISDRFAITLKPLHIGPMSSPSRSSARPGRRTLLGY